MTEMERMLLVLRTKAEEMAKRYGHALGSWTNTPPWRGRTQSRAHCLNCGFGVLADPYSAAGVAGLSVQLSCPRQPEGQE